jgi:hypothetical protein
MQLPENSRYDAKLVLRVLIFVNETPDQIQNHSMDQKVTNEWLKSPVKCKWLIISAKFRAE